MPSPKVTLKEEDRSTRVPSFPGVYGAIVGPFKKGPLEPSLVTSDSQLLSRYTPDETVKVGYDLSYYSALTFLEKSNTLWVVRALGVGHLYGGIGVYKEGSMSAGTMGISAGIDVPETYPFDNETAPGSPAEFVVTPERDTANNLNNTYFELNDPDTAYYAWFNTGAGVDPAPAGKTGIEVSINTDDSANAVAIALQAALDAEADFEAAINAGSSEETTVTAQPNTTASLQSVYFQFSSTVVDYYVWINHDGGGVDPAGSNVGRTAIEVTLPSGDQDADTVAAALQSAINGVTGVTATVLGSDVTIVIDDPGVVNSAVNAGNSTMTVVQSVAGVDSTVTVTNANNGVTIDPAVGTTSWSSPISGIVAGTDVDDSEECMLIYAIYPGDWANGSIGIKIINYANHPEDVKEEDSFILTVYKDDVAVEEFTCSRIQGKKDGYGNNIYVEDALEASAYIRCIDNVGIAEATQPQEVATIALIANGNDGAPVTDSDMLQALDKIKSPSEYFVTVLMDGGWATPTFQNALISTAENRQDCVAVLSVPFANENSSDYLNEVIFYRKDTLNANTSYATLSTPHVLIGDRFNDREIYISPDGYAAAAISATAANYEIWYPQVGKYKINVNDVRRRYSEGELDLLADNGINPIRFKAGKGVQFLGQRTLLAKPSALDRLNVRLLLIVIGPAIKEALEDFLFEINDSDTRSIASAMVNSYMRGIKGRKGVYEFKFICDDTNNTNEDVANHRMNAHLYVEPIQGVEQIPFKVVITKPGGISVMLG